jgi:hypothetical protein
MTFALGRSSREVVPAQDAPVGVHGAELDEWPAAQEGGPMRRVALGAAVAALLAVVAVAFGSGGPPAPSAPTTLKWRANSERGVSEREPGQDLLGYWGQLQPRDSATPNAYYRARCVWLRQADNDQIACTIIVMVPGTGSIVLEGLLSRPTHGTLLADDGSGQKLPITGATGKYNPNRGWADVNPVGAPSAALDVTVK